jgi:predicted O-methyltransferase YrrM
MSQLLSRLSNAVSNVLHQEPLEITWCKPGEGWLKSNLPPTFPKAPRKMAIEDRAWQTERQGAQPLAEVYGQPGATRTPGEVRSSGSVGNLFAWLAQTRRPDVVVEFGTAFGLSGMYWLAGLEAANTGHLYSFEINPGWAAIASENLRAIGQRFTLTVGPFEEHVQSVVPGPIDIAFVDGIHTYDWVLSQYEILQPRAARGAILCFDDIDFPSGRMRECWQEIVTRKEVKSACEVDKRLGLAELQ